MFRAAIVLLLAAAIARPQSDTWSVTRFGAHPDDGLTDSTPGIQAAIDASHGGRVHLPADIAGSGAAVAAVVSEGRVTGFEIRNPGANYCKPPRIVITGGATARAAVDPQCRLTSVTVEKPGEGYTTPPPVLIVPAHRCYKVSQIHIFSGSVLEGDGAATCIIPDGSNKPVIFSEGANGFRLRDFSLRGDGVTDIGMQFNGAAGPLQSNGTPAADASKCTLDGIEVSGFRAKNIELNRSFGFVFLNVFSSGSAGWGLYLRDGYNNATQVISGEYSANGIGGVYIGVDSIEFQFSSIAEGNGKYGLYYHGHLTGLLISDAYFEANGQNGEGWDVYGDFLDYDQPAIGVSIRNTLFNSQHARNAAYFENTVDLDFSHNIGIPGLVGDPFRANTVVLAGGVIDPRFEGNTSLRIVTAAGTPLFTAGPPFFENLFAWSTMMSARVWRAANTGPGCTASAVCRDGARFEQNGGAWKVPLPDASGAANMTTVTQELPVTEGGHLVGAGVWVRADSGTATGWVEIADGAAAYTGSTLHQRWRQTIDSNWQWISANVATASQGGRPHVTFRFYRNDFSDARAIYLYAPQSWLDTAVTPQYAPTRSLPLRRGLSLPPVAAPAPQPFRKP